MVDEFKKKRPHLHKKKILLYDDNIPSHTLNIAQTKKHQLGFESLPNPPYSPDLDPSDYYRFPNIKTWLCGRRFESNEEVEWEIEGYFGGFDKSYHFEGIEKLKGFCQNNKFLLISSRQYQTTDSDFDVQIPKLIFQDGVFKRWHIIEFSYIHIQIYIYICISCNRTQISF